MKIFRKKRLKLLLAGKIGRYFRYAIGEILLVVIGILIALQINTWNQNKKDNRALKEYLIKIKSHTQEDLRELDTITKYRTQIGNLCKKARASMLDHTEGDNLILFMTCGVAFADYYFKPNTGGYDALKNSPYFGKINNSNLDSLLTAYHGLIGEIKENEKSYNDYAVNQETFLSTQFDRTLILASAFLPQDSLRIRAARQSEYIKAFKEYTAAPAYRNVINLAAFQFDAMVLQYKKLRNVGENVIAEINTMTDE